MSDDKFVTAERGRKRMARALIGETESPEDIAFAQLKVVSKANVVVKNALLARSRDGGEEQVELSGATTVVLSMLDAAVSTLASEVINTRVRSIVRLGSGYGGEVEHADDMRPLDEYDIAKLNDSEKRIAMAGMLRGLSKSIPLALEFADAIEGVSYEESSDLLSTNAEKNCCSSMVFLRKP
jgi:hypothetical protein